MNSDNWKECERNVQLYKELNAKHIDVECGRNSHQNGLNGVFNFKVKLISFESALEEEWNRENRFWLRHVQPELWDFKEILLHPPEPYFSLKNDPSDIFFTVFCKISWFCGDTYLL